MVHQTRTVTKLDCFAAIARCAQARFALMAAAALDRSESTGQFLRSLTRPVDSGSGRVEGHSRMASEAVVYLVDIDVEALKEKYRQERDKRLRKEGELQYFDVADDYAGYFEPDPYSDPIVRDPISDEIDVAVLGGGFAGLMAGAHLRQEGIGSFRIIEMGGDFGGTWYWNRYPGVQCDIESYCYLPLLEELNYVPKEKYSYGAEIFEHCRKIGQHFDLYEAALFQTAVTSLRWDAAIDRWRIATNRGDDIRARFLIMASGPYNRAKLPGIPGIKSFKGKSFHTSRWDYDYTGGDTNGGLVKLADKRVGIIGTGATAIQAVPHLGRWAKQLYVFQRTPSPVDERRNQPTDPEWAKSLKPGWSLERRENFHTVVTGAPFEEDLVADGWTLINHRIAARMAEIPEGELTEERAARVREIEDFRWMNDLRDRVEQVVTRKDAAEALKPWYRWQCKRPTFNDDYLPTFNRDNVTLVDVSASQGVERITETGLVANGVDYELDCIIYASGFEITTDMKRRIGIPVFEGRDGLSLYDHWRDGFRTLHGFTTSGFPNAFFTGFIQGGISASLTAQYDAQTNHIAYIIRAALDRGATRVEVTEEAQDEWVRTLRATTFSNTEFLNECTPGYYNNEGGPVRRSHIGEVYGLGFHAFTALLEDWRNSGEMKGLELGGKT
jgi:cyclohexanone monooxygenase